MAAEIGAGTAEKREEQWNAEREWLDLLLRREARRLRAETGEFPVESAGDLSGELTSEGGAESAEGREALFAAELAELTTRAESRREAARRGRPEDSPLNRVAAAFRLSPEEEYLLILAFAPELSLHYEALYGYLNGDLTRRWASCDLALRLFGGDAAGRAKIQATLLPDAPLFREGLLRRIDPIPDRPLWRASGFSVASPVAAALLSDTGFVSGADNLEWRIFPDVRSLNPPNEPSAILFLTGRRGSGRFAEAAAEARKAQCRGIWRWDLGAARASGEPLSRLAAELPLRLRLTAPAALYIAGGDGLFDAAGGGPLPDAAPLLRRLRESGARIFVGAGVGADIRRLASEVPLHVRLLPPPGPDERRRLWREALVKPGTTGIARTKSARTFFSEEAIAAVADWFTLTPGEIAQAAARAQGAAGGNGEKDKKGDKEMARLLYDAADEAAAHGLDRLAQRAGTTATWDDLIVPEATRRRLLQIRDATLQQRRVLREWGFADGLAAGRAVKALFVGPPGTGKSLAAAVIAADLGRPLHRVNLANLVSKYIGETEKNLDELFHQSVNGGGILCFDEADAIFGKRSEVKDAHDRYANIEVSYLLQKFEGHDGPVFLTSNLGGNIDPAFSRRLEWLVEFPSPDRPQRALLWRRLLPPGAPRDRDIDFDFLAERFAFAGGDIRNAVLTAAYLAAAADSPIGLSHLLRGVASQLRRQGRLPSPADFAPYQETLQH